MMKRIRSFIGVFVVILLCTTMCLSSFANEDKLVSFSGDVNGDGQITLLDALRLLRYICISEVEVEESNADVNGDGLVNIEDVLLLVKAISNDDCDKNEGEKMERFLISADLGDTTPISDKLYGIFLEDVSYSVDGGLYAEMVKNNSFEYEEEYANNGALHAFTVEDGVTATVIDGSIDESYLNANNVHYLRLVNSTDAPLGIINAGYMEGMSVTENGEYRISIFAKGDNVGEIEFSVIDADGRVYGKTALLGFNETWSKKEATFVATESGTNLSLAIRVSGSADIDCVSLMPTDTYKGSVIRKDLGEMLEGLSPKFFRFPGGCIIEGYHLEDAYDWKASVGNGTYTVINGETVCGDISARVAENNRKWGRHDTTGNYPYYMSYGIGFYEYFEFCENLGCIPIPVINAGISCQCVLSETAEIGTPEFQKFIDDMLDLVEFANGGEDTYWGKIRADMGHPEPFGLEYISIGNEQKPDDVYYTRYAEFVKALNAAKEENPKLYGNIKIMQSLLSHNFEILDTTDRDYSAYVDIHYYRQAEWLIENAHRYDGLSRGENTAPVYVGEYAGKDNSIYSAIAEAAHMTGFENNGDVVAMACYAPLLANLNKYNWTPNMIWFNNSVAYGSTSYYVQKLFANNCSTSVAKATVIEYTEKDNFKDIPSGMVGVGTYATTAKFDNIKVVSNSSGEVLYSDSFDTNSMAKYTVVDGSWAVFGGSLQQKTEAVTNSYTANVVYFGDTAWSDYTFTFEATKLSGTEGFIIPICVKDNDNWYHWNIGGYSNKVSTLGKAVDGKKSGIISDTKSTFTVETNKTYTIKIVVTESSVRGYIDGVKYIDYIFPEYEGNVITKALLGNLGVGTYATTAKFDNIKVVLNSSGEELYSDSFSKNTMENYTVIDGTWEVSNGSLHQKAETVTNSYTANVVYFGDTAWSNYTFTLEATKLSGREGFIIPICVKNNDNWYHWNIGGWGNTSTALAYTVDGAKTNLTSETGRAFEVEIGRTYELKVVVTDERIECYIDGEKYIDYTVPKNETIYQVTGFDENGDIVVKIVNVSGEAVQTRIKLKNTGDIYETADVTVFGNENRDAKNTLANPTVVVPTSTTMKISRDFEYNAPAYSLTVIKIRTSK